MVGIPRIQNLTVPPIGASRPLSTPATLPPTSAAAADSSKIAVFSTSAEARAEVLRRDPTLEHAIGQYRDEKHLHFYVTTGTAGGVLLDSGYNLYMHTHPEANPCALPSFQDMSTFASQAQEGGVPYETMIYSTSPTNPELCHLRWLGGRRFHLIYADGTPPSTPPTTPEFFGPTREFEVTIDHDPRYGHRELVVTTRATATPLTYRFTEHDAMSCFRSEQWFWERILTGDSPEEVSSTVRRMSVFSTSRPARLLPRDGSLTSALIAFGLPAPESKPPA